MSIQEKERLMEGLINENPDTTVKDLMEAIKEIEGIAMFACEPMPDASVLREIKKMKKSA